VSFHDIFDELETQERVSLLHGATEIQFEEGDVLIQQNQPNKRIFIIMDGDVRVERVTDEDDRVTLATLGLADIFGEMTLLTGRPASAQVVAASPGKALCLSHESIRTRMKKYPGFAGRLFYSFAVTLAIRLSETNMKL
jgi:CRP-like cAMP-binding protein